MSLGLFEHEIIFSLLGYDKSSSLSAFFCSADLLEIDDMFAGRSNGDRGCFYFILSTPEI